MSKRPTPPYRSLTENPKWAKVQCERCGVDFWLEHCKVGTILYCTKTCRYEDPLIVIEKRTVKEGHPKGCWICDLTPSSEYPCLKTKGEQLRACRIVLAHTLGRPIAEGMEAAHTCNNARCVNPDHIKEWTHAQNIQYQIECGRKAVGMDFGHTKLTIEQIKEIKTLKGTDILEVVAEKFHVGITTISDIWNGKRWADI